MHKGHIVAKEHPKEGVCEHCGSVGETQFAYKHHPAPYVPDREAYLELCRSCHTLMDNAGYRQRSEYAACAPRATTRLDRAEARELRRLVVGLRVSKATLRALVEDAVREPQSMP